MPQSGAYLYHDWLQAAAHPGSEALKPVPVSYTHLDVYKRQVVIISDVSPSPSSNATASTSCGRVPFAAYLSLIHIYTLAFGYILPTTGRIRDFNPLETCAARRTTQKLSLIHI